MKTCRASCMTPVCKNSQHFRNDYLWSLFFSKLSNHLSLIEGTYKRNLEVFFFKKKYYLESLFWSKTLVQKVKDIFKEWRSHYGRRCSRRDGEGKTLLQPSTQTQLKLGDVQISSWQSSGEPFFEVGPALSRAGSDDLGGMKSSWRSVPSHVS